MPRLGNLELNYVEITHKPYNLRVLTRHKVFLVVIACPFTQDLMLTFVACQLFWETLLQVVSDRYRLLSFSIMWFHGEPHSPAIHTVNGVGWLCRSFRFQAQRCCTSFLPTFWRPELRSGGPPTVRGGWEIARLHSQKENEMFGWTPGIISDIHGKFILNNCHINKTQEPTCLRSN